MHAFVLLASALLATLTGACASPPARALVHESLAFERTGAGAPTLVFVHGWAGDGAVWGPLAERLRTDHDVVVVDLPGHGRTAPLASGGAVEDVAATLAAFCREQRVDDCVLVGHGMGAVIAVLAAEDLPGRVRGIVPVNSLHSLIEPLSAPQIELSVQAFEADWKRAFDALLDASLPAGARSPLGRWLAGRAESVDHDAALRLLASCAGLDVGAHARAAGVPIRAINAAPGFVDAVTFTEANRRVVDFDAVLIPDVGHFLQLEQPAGVERALRAILDGWRR